MKTLLFVSVIGISAALEAGLVVNPKAFDATRLAPRVIMGKDYWSHMKTGPYADPGYPLSEADKATGLQNLPVFKECSLDYGVPGPAQTSLEHATWYKLSENVDYGGKQSFWLAFLANEKKNVPKTLYLSAKRQIESQYGKIHLDYKEFDEFRAQHPNLIALTVLDEWIVDVYHMKYRVDNIKNEAARKEVKARMLNFPFDREGKMKSLKAYVDRQRQVYWGCDELFGAMRSGCGVDHLPAAWGAKLLGMETSNTSRGDIEHRWEIAGMFVRGAARQFNIPWYWYMAIYYFGYSQKGELLTDAVCTYGSNHGNPNGKPDNGVSPSLFNRGLYHAYLNGANFVEPEHWEDHLILKNPEGATVLSDRGELFSQYHNFTREHPNRGTTYAPVAVLLPFDQGYNDWGGVSFIGEIGPYRKGDHMVDGVFYSIVPGRQRWAQLREGIENCLHNAPLAMMYDVLVPDSPQPKADFSKALAAYPAAILAGEYRNLESVWSPLFKYVKEGGTLIVPPANLTPELKDRLSTATGRTLLDADGTERGTAYDLGKGRLVVGKSEWMTPEWTDGRQTIAETQNGTRKFPEIEYFLKQLQDDLFPAKVEGSCLYGATKTEKGWWVWTINNRGVKKFADAPQVIDPRGASVVKITLKGSASKVREIVRGRDMCVKEGSFSYVIPSGEVAVFEIDE